MRYVIMEKLCGTYGYIRTLHLALAYWMKSIRQTWAGQSGGEACLLLAEAKLIRTVVDFFSADLSSCELAELDHFGSERHELT